MHLNATASSIKFLKKVSYSFNHLSKIKKFTEEFYKHIS